MSSSFCRRKSPPIYSPKPQKSCCKSACMPCKECLPPCPPPMPPCPPPPCPPPPCPPPPGPETCRPMPRVICSGREAQRNLHACIAVSGLPCNICGPLRLLGLESTGEKPDVRLLEDCRGPSPWIAEVTIPLLAWVQDATGCTHCGQTQVKAYCSMPSCCDHASAALVACAEVRLVDACGLSCTPEFEVRLQIFVEVYVVRVEPCKCHRKKECALFPQMPMYPQPAWYP